MKRMEGEKVAGKERNGETVVAEKKRVTRNISSIS